MEIDIIEAALISAMILLNREVDTIEYEELKNEYLTVIGKLQTALQEVRNE